MPCLYGKKTNTNQRMKNYLLLLSLSLFINVINSNATSESIAKEIPEKQEYQSSQSTEPLTLTVTANDVKCFGGNDGTAIASVSGGNPPYSYSWNDPLIQTTINATNLKAGIYAITANDASGNTVSASITIKEPNALDVSIEVNTVSTYGGSDGSIVFINPRGGSGSYEYSLNGLQWSAGNKIENLKAGIYSTQIRDANSHSCITIKGNYEITEQVQISATVQTSDATCFGANDGTIRISDLQNGQPPYQFSLDRINWMASNVFTGLRAGIYDVNVIDSKNSITKLVSVNINQPDKIEAKCTNTNVTSLEANNGTITVTGQKGGSGTYEYSKDGITWQSSTFFDGLTPGTYTIWVRDANSLSCKISQTVTILKAISITGSIAWVNVTCFGANDGFVAFSNPTGAINYEYSIGLNWQSTNNFTGLPAGTYSAMIRDANNTANVSILATITITEPAPLNAVVTATAETFAGAKDGIITISNPTGGSGSYEFSIDGTNWTSSSQFTGITSGTYTIRVRDRNAPACQIVFSTAIQPAGTLIADVTHTNISCYSENNGSIVISNASGATVFQYSIDGGTTWTASGVFYGLSAGSYDAMIRDANNTANIISLGKVTITQSTRLFVAFSNYSHPLCAGTSGTFTISAIGGTPPYTGTGDFVLPSGASRRYTITDRNGCTAFIDVSMPDPPKITATAIVTPPNYCNENGTITIAATGGTGTLTGVGTFPVQADYSGAN